MVVKAKNKSPMLTRYWPMWASSPWAKAWLVMAAPLKSPLHTPVTTRVRPVMVQMMMVSMKVPVMETSPCSTQESVLAAAAAMGAEPSPDSLEKTPRATPDWIASMMPAPTKPPVAAWPVKALSITSMTASGSALALFTSTPAQARM
ncbi:hypothetical protein D3C84_872160 [compost metagenome]